jgi:hypothetical protein
MKKVRPLLFTVFACWAFSASAAIDIGLGTTVFSKDTLPFGDTLHISTFIKNYDTNVFTDSVKFGLKINGIQNVNQNIFPNPIQGQQLNIAPGDSFPVSLIVVITPAYFQVGPDILVVWPIVAGGSPSRDTLVKTIQVIIPTDINEPTGENNIKSYWFNNRLFINTDNPSVVLEKATIYNLSGQKIEEQPLGQSNSIPFNTEPAGIYIAEVFYNGNLRKVLKFVKQ